MNRNFPGVMTTSHIAVGGLGLGLLEIEQTTKAINLVISLFDLPTPSSFLLKESLEYMQLEAGIEKLILETKFEVFGKLVTPCWLRSLWESLSYYQLKLHLPTAVQLSSNVTNDCAIMVKVVRLKVFESNKIMAINRVRLYLQVIFISDLVQWVSNKIIYCYRQGDRDTTRQSNYKPLISVPAKKDFRV